MTRWLAGVAAVVLAATVASFFGSLRLSYVTPSTELEYSLSISAGEVSAGWIPPDRCDGAVPVAGWRCSLDGGSRYVSGASGAWRPVHCAASHWPHESSYHFVDVPLWIPLLMTLVPACFLLGRGRSTSLRWKPVWVWTSAAAAVVLGVVTIGSCNTDVVFGYATEKWVGYVQLAHGELRLNGGDDDVGHWKTRYWDDLDRPRGPGFWCLAFPGLDYSGSCHLSVDMLPSSFLDGVSVPLWWPTLLAIMSASYVFGAGGSRKARPGECGACGYDLAGVQAPAVCPECGVVPAS